MVKKRTQPVLVFLVLVYFCNQQSTLLANYNKTECIYTELAVKIRRRGYPILDGDYQATLTTTVFLVVFPAGGGRGTCLFFLETMSS